MNYTNQIFKMLNIRPGEKFSLFTTDSDKNKATYVGLYSIDEDLITHKYDHPFCTVGRVIDLRILDGILRGDSIIEKLKTYPSKAEQIAIDYAKCCGYNWMAKEENGAVFAFQNKPRKSTHTWFTPQGGELMRIKIPISFLSWGDEEPYYIGGDK